MVANLKLCKVGACATSLDSRLHILIVRGGGRQPWAGIYFGRKLMIDIHVGCFTVEGIYSNSIFCFCRTNLPKEVMAFPDFPFPADWRSYMHHTQVLKYLRSYSTHFGVDNVVQLNTAVTRVHPLKCGDGEKVTWEVTVRKFDEQKSLTSEFDAVVVCNG